jgi:hypothetical protein
MIATIAVIAERAEVRADGKLDVVGVYNCRYTHALPAKLDVTLAIRFDIEPLDYGVHQNISVHIMDEDGKLARQPGDFRVAACRGFAAGVRPHSAADCWFSERRDMDVRRTGERESGGASAAAHRATSGLSRGDLP